MATTSIVTCQFQITMAILQTGATRLPSIMDAMQPMSFIMETLLTPSRTRMVRGIREATRDIRIKDIRTRDIPIVDQVTRIITTQLGTFVLMKVEGTKPLV